MNNSQKIRKERYESRMTQCLNEFISLKVYDSKMKSARITYSRLSNDMSVLKLYIDSLNRDKIDKIVDTLNKNKGLFRSELASKFDLRRVPQLFFLKDDRSEKYEEISKIFDELKISKGE